jgi:hypothetical protein
MFLALPGWGQELLDPPLKNWPTPAYWAPTPANADRAEDLPGTKQGLERRNEAGIRAAAAGATKPLAFVAITPCRLIDTRTGFGQTGEFGPPALSAFVNRTFTIPSHPTCAIPATAKAYSLNFAVVPPSGLDYLAAWPAGQTWPGTATLNAPIGGIVSNSAIVPAGTNGAITIFGSQATHLVVDINGYFAGNGTAMSGIVNSDGTASILPTGASVTHPGTGQYILSFPAGTFAPSTSNSAPVAVFSAIQSAASTGTVSYTLPVDGSAQISVSWTANTAFSFQIVQN